MQRSDAALDRAGTPVVYIQLHPRRSVSDTASQFQLWQANTGALPREVAACLSEGPQRVREESPVTAECSTCSRQDGNYLGSATGAAHVALFWQGFFTCLQNLKACSVQQRPTLQYINQIFLGWLIASVFCWWIFIFTFFFFSCNTAGPYATERDNGWNLGSPEVSHETHCLHWSHVFINCLIILCISHMEEI